MKKLLVILRYLLFLGAGAGLMWLTFRNQSFSDVAEKISHADFRWLFLSIILSILALISRAMRWVQLIEPTGYKPRLFSTFNAVMFGYLANMALPRLGEISRCGSLTKSDNVPFDRLLGTVIIERVADVIMLALSIMTVAILEFDRLGGFFRKQFWEPFLQKTEGAATILWIAALCIVLGIILTIRLFRMKNPPAIIKKILGLFAGIGEGLKSFTRLKNKPLFVFHTFFIWTMYVLMTYICFFALKETSHLDFSAGFFMMVLGGIGMTAPVQGGIGTYHILVSRGMLLYGISEMDGTVFATMVHTTQTVLLITLGAFSMICLFFFTKPVNSKIDGAL